MDFFQEDKKRHLLARKNRFNKLKQTYVLKTRQKNINKPELWDEKIADKRDFEKQGPVAKDRIKTASKFCNENDIILDIGFGHGYLEELLKRKKGISLYGIDISLKAVKKAQKEFQGNFKIGSILKIPFKKRYFDKVFALEALEHLPASDVFRAYSEIKKVLKREGEFIASIPVNEKYTLKYNPNKHMRSYTPELFLAELKLAGFIIESKTFFYAFKNLYSFKKLLSKIFVKRWQPNMVLVKCRIK